MTLVAADAPARSRALGLTGICLGFLMITPDATIVNVALGPIGADLGGALSTAQWIVNGYTLAFAALLLSAGALADRAGARTGFLVGLAVFVLGSAACAGAASLTVLIAARVVPGAGRGGGGALPARAHRGGGGRGGGRRRFVALLAGPHRARFPGSPRPPQGAGPVGRRVGDRPGGRPGGRRRPDRRLGLARDL